jgi:hypothetical protein
VTPIIYVPSYFSVNLVMDRLQTVREASGNARRAELIPVFDRKYPAGVMTNLLMSRFERPELSIQEKGKGEMPFQLLSLVKQERRTFSAS